MIKLAFDSIGVSLSNAVRDTHNEMDVVGVVHVAAKYVQQELLDSFASKDLPPWLLVQRAFDGTPCEVVFGSLDAVIAPMAKYKWRQDAKQPWSMLSYDELRQMSGARRRRQHGCLEFLAQTFLLVWPAGDIDDIDNTRVEDIVLGPSYLADGPLIGLESLCV